jgi:hypothetical protein
LNLTIGHNTSQVTVTTTAAVSISIGLTRIQGFLSPPLFSTPLSSTHSQNCIEQSDEGVISDLNMTDVSFVSTQKDSENATVYYFFAALDNTANITITVSFISFINNQYFF